ncbi:type I restriction endonuclease subunit R [Methanolobus sp. WCC5]|uniref:type I restriction endonuclease subunit R n=1 Tax=Methanolobus sp. WCC5 TaxID=3125785 RepID=UPI003249B682
MNTVGQRERQTQNRVVKLFSDKKILDYKYLGNWQDRENNRNIEECYLIPFLRDEQGYDESLVTKALYELNKVAGDQSRRLYDTNKDVYSMLRYGVKVKPEHSENTQTVWLIDWENPLRNHFAIAEEVTIVGEHTKRPDIVLYVNGIALGVLELKRSTISVSEGIRQNLGNQNSTFIRPFFSTIQLIMAGNDTQGLRYGTIETKEKYYLTWKEESEVENLLDRHLLQLCNKERFLEIIHNFIVFDSGTKKVCRPNQYFGVKAAQPFIHRREGGIIWHTQGSGKSLTMVWLAKWIRENLSDSRVLLITDRVELDDQIEKVFKGVSEEIYQTKNGQDLINKLNANLPWLICSLIHKFGSKAKGTEETDIDGFVEEISKALPSDFKAKGNIYVFVDECHRTQSNKLHAAMKRILPDAMFIGFTGTPLLKKDKKTSMEIFGRYIHTYKYDEAVADGVVLDLRYEARDIDQTITSQAKIDQWFEAKTRGLNDIAKAQLKKRWGTMQKVLSSQSRLEKIVADILLDMETKDRLQSGRGNAMLVTSSIYEACKCYELFTRTDLLGKCAIVTSYKPSPADIKVEDSGEGLTERLRQYEIYRKMLAEWFNEPEDTAMYKVEEFEKAVKKKFIEEPGQMKLLIVVDKLLTGFDAPPATYLYIDKQMRDHGLFQAICRVNRLDEEDKEYGYIVDYKDLFKSLERAIDDYTSEAFDGYEKEDVEGLLSNRVDKARERLEETLEAVRALCEPVIERDTTAYLHYFCAADTTNKDELKENEPKRLALYKAVAALLRAYSNIASDMVEAGYKPEETLRIRHDVEHYEMVRNEVKLASGDYIDLKMYEPAMRHLIDTYIRAEDSEKISAFDDMSLVQLIVERGQDVIQGLPKSISESREAIAETIENNVRRLIIDESPINPKYYEKMSELLDALILERKAQAIEYKEYLRRIVELTNLVYNPTSSSNYPKTLNTQAKRALYDNLGQDEGLALRIDEAVLANKQDDWQNNHFKRKLLRNAVQSVLYEEQQIGDVMKLVEEQEDYK